jgi:hypothetical protein
VLEAVQIWVPLAQPAVEEQQQLLLLGEVSQLLLSSRWRMQTFH